MVFLQVTYQRLKATLDELKSTDVEFSMLGGHLVQVAFDKKRAPGVVPKIPQWSPANQQLDESQNQAINMALAAQDIALIHGPPGSEVSNERTSLAACKERNIHTKCTVRGLETLRMFLLVVYNPCFKNCPGLKTIIL